MPTNPFYQPETKQKAKNTRTREFMTAIKTSELIELAKELLLQVTAVPTAPVEILNAPSTWRAAIAGLALRTIDNHEAIELLVSHELPKPAAALLRNTTEAWLQLAYLHHYPENLRSWALHQLNQAHSTINDSQLYDYQLDDHQTAHNQAFLSFIDQIPHYDYQRPSNPWVPIKTLFKKVLLTDEVNRDTVKQMRRHLYQVPSIYVHAGFAGDPDTKYLKGNSNFTTILTIDTAIAICKTQSLLTPRTEPIAIGIADTIQNKLDPQTNV